VWPLSPSFDTVGPLAGDVAGLVIGMQLLEPGFQPASPKGLRIGRLRVDADPVVDTAVDGALLASGWDVADVPLPLWADASVAAGTLLVHEAWLTDRLLVEADPDGIGADVLARLRSGGDYGETVLAAARATGDAWRAELAAAFQRFDFIATPTLTILPPRLEDADALLTGRCTIPINLAGVPALSLPAPTPAGLPASVQLIGPSGSEADLLAAGSILEEAVSP
jgi:amidase